MAEHMNITQICVAESLEWSERIRVSVKGVKIAGFGKSIRLDGKWLFEEGCFGSFENLCFTNGKLFASKATVCMLTAERRSCRNDNLPAIPERILALPRLPFQVRSELDSGKLSA